MWSLPPPQVNYLTNEFTGEPLEETAWCNIPHEVSSRTPVYLMIMSTVIAFIVPFTLAIVLYFK